MFFDRLGERAISAALFANTSALKSCRTGWLFFLAEFQSVFGTKMTFRSLDPTVETCSNASSAVWHPVGSFLPDLFNASLPMVEEIVCAAEDGSQGRCSSRDVGHHHGLGFNSGFDAPLLVFAAFRSSVGILLLPR